MSFERIRGVEKDFELVNPDIHFQGFSNFLDKIDNIFDKTKQNICAKMDKIDSGQVAYDKPQVNNINNASFNNPMNNVMDNAHSFAYNTAPNIFDVHKFYGSDNNSNSIFGDNNNNSSRFA